MIDASLFVNSLLIATPAAGMAILVGALGLKSYRRHRDRELELQIKREMEHEQRRFALQREIEKLRFEWDQQRSREELSRKTALVMLNERINAYGQVWKIVAGIPANKDAVSVEDLKEMAVKVRTWRFNKGGLLADPLTREAILAVQRALWEYDESDEAFALLRRARRVMRMALRTELGLSEQKEGNASKPEREVIQEELAEIRRVLISGPATGELVG